MYYKFFPKIYKSKLPKTACRWSFSVIFVYPVFVIANKLWSFLYVYIILNFINFIFIVSGLDKNIVDLISIATFAVFMFITFYLVIYGRALAWQKLDYQDNERDTAKFKLRQRIVLYANILIIGLVVVYVFYSLNNARYMIIS